MIAKLKAFFVWVDRVTNEWCKKHPNQKIDRFIGCEECYREEVKVSKNKEREEKINIIKEAIIRASQESK